MTKKRLKGIIAQFIVVMTIFQSNQLLAQDDPALPEGLGINQLQTSENLSQGVLNINLPIENHLVPVSIGYTTSGIRVNQRPGIVGLGWNLNAGGFIARQKRGMADDDQKTANERDKDGYSGKHKRGQWVVNLPNQYYFDQFTGLEQDGNDGGPWDPEPDIYVFQFMGQSGRFTMDHNRNVVKLSPNNLKITPIYNTTSDAYTSFTIQDEQGNEYDFTVSEFTRLKQGATEIDYYRSKWHLTKITQYSTGDEINLNYITAPTTSEISYFRWERENWTTAVFHSNNSSAANYSTEYTAKLLDEISFNDTKIKFDYSDRDDISTLKKLHSITYKLNGNTTIVYNLNYKYLGSGSSKRLMLSGIYKSSLNLILYQFNYYGEEDGEPVLPPYNDTKQDDWGFYNNNNTGTLYKHDGGWRVPFLANARANSLKKTYYTAGGFDEYVYELNQYNLSGTNKTAGGLRIAEVYKNDGLGTSYLTKSYGYTSPSDGQSSGEIYAEPVYFREFQYGATKLKEHRQFSLEPLRDDVGRHLCYEYVSVTDIDGGSQLFHYHTFADDKTIFGTGNFSAELIKGYHNHLGDDNNDHYANILVTPTSWAGPFGNRNFKGTAVGLLKERKVFDNVDKVNPLSSDIYSYQTHHTPTNLVKGMVYTHTAGNGSVRDFKLRFYELGYGYILNDKITNIIYDRDDPTKASYSYTDIFYDSNNPLEIRRETYGKIFIGTTKKQINKVEYLFKEPSPPSEVTNNNLKSLVKEQISLIDTEEIGSSVSNYGTNSNTSKLELKDVKTYRKIGTNDILTSDILYSYDSEGRPSGALDQMSNFENCTILDHDGLRVMAEVSNASLSEIAFTSFEGDGSGGWTTPTLVSEDECSGLQSECMQDCLDNNPVSACFNQCTTQYNTCATTVNLASGVIGESSFELSDGNLTKVLAAGTYTLGYWKNSGTVNISGPSSNTLLHTRTLVSWTLEERKINMSSTGTLTISGTADIDHLRVHPDDAQMSTYTYHTVFGKTSETDANNNTIFYEYDNSGRLILVKDRNKDIIKKNEFNIAQYFDLSATSFSAGYAGGTKKIYVSSNDGYWTVSDNANSPDWVTVSPTSGSNNGHFEITVIANPNTSSRNATVTIGNSLPGIAVNISQAAAPPTGYINLSPGSLTFTTNSEAAIGATVSVSSNVNWTPRIDYTNGTINISSVTSTSFKVSATYTGSGFAVIKVEEDATGIPVQSLFVTY